MTEMYQTARDGYVSGRVATGAAKARGSVVPSYARRTSVVPKGLSGQGLWDAVDAMKSRLVH